MLSNLTKIYSSYSWSTWRCLWLLSFGLSFAKKLINSFTNNPWSSCFESCLCWLSYYKCRCGCCSGWCACCCWKRNQRHRPSKKWICVFGDLEIYVIGGNQPTDENQSIDLLHFMHDKKDQIQKLIMERVAEGSRKVQFSANLGLVKPREIIDSSNIEPDERGEIYANSDMKPVISLWLEDDEFFEMIEKMPEI